MESLTKMDEKDFRFEIAKDIFKDALLSVTTENAKLKDFSKKLVAQLADLLEKNGELIEQLNAKEIECETLKISLVQKEALLNKSEQDAIRQTNDINAILIKENEELKINLSKAIHLMNTKKISTFNPNAQGCVYLVQSGESYKIGYSTNFENRLASLRTHNAQINVIRIMSVPNFKEVEKFLHSKYYHLRTNGEWFNLSDVDVRWICEVDEFELIYAAQQHLQDKVA